MPRLTCWKLATSITCAAAPGKWEHSVRAAASSREILAAAETLASLVNENKVVIFSRGRSTATARVMNYFEELGIPYYALELENREDGAALIKALAVHTSATFPLYADGGRKRLCATCLALLYSVLRVRGIDSRLRRGHHEYPAIFIQGQHIQGGTSKIGQAYKTGELEHWVSDDEPEEARAPKDAAFLKVVRHEL
jgi:glutaredoxin-related protein